MQSLVGADISPEELARQIRRLRDEWRTLHRGAGEEPTPEWQQFDDGRGARLRALSRALRPAGRTAQGEPAAAGSAARAAGGLRGGQTGEQTDWSSDPPGHLRGTHRVAAVRAGGPVGREGAAGAVPCAARRAAVAPRRRVRAQRAGEARHDCARRRAREPRGHAPGHRGNEEPAAGLEDRRARAATPGQCALGGVPAQLRRRLRAQLAGVRGARRRARGQPGAGVCAVRRTGSASRRCPASRCWPAIQQLDELCNEFESLELPRASARDLRQRFNRATDRCTESIRGHREAAARRGWTDLFEAAAARSAPTRSRLRSAVRRTTARHCGRPQRPRSQALEHAPKGTRALLETAAGKDCRRCGQQPTWPPTRRRCGCCAFARS